MCLFLCVSPSPLPRPSLALPPPLLLFLVCFLLFLCLSVCFSLFLFLFLSNPCSFVSVCFPRLSLCVFLHFLAVSRGESLSVCLPVGVSVCMVLVSVFLTAFLFLMVSVFLTAFLFLSRFLSLSPSETLSLPLSLSLSFSVSLCLSLVRVGALVRSRSLYRASALALPLNLSLCHTHVHRTKMMGKLTWKMNIIPPKEIYKMENCKMHSRGFKKCWTCSQVQFMYLMTVMLTQTYIALDTHTHTHAHTRARAHTHTHTHTHTHSYMPFGHSVKAGLGIFETNVRIQWNPAYNAFHRMQCCGNETNVSSISNVILTRQICGQRSGMAAGGKRRAIAFHFSVRICYMFLMSKCRGESDLGLCMTSVLAKRMPLRSTDFRF